MFSRILTLAATAAAVARATDGSAAPAVTDTDILQYALTLEHLESAFYSGGLAKFSASDFASGGEQHALFAQIADHEATHVTVLTSVIGADTATKACNYSFPYTDVQSFKSLAQVLEGVGVTGYLGAAQFITNPAILTAAGAILTTEARHAAWLASTNGADPWPGAFDTPLEFSQVYSLAAPFITSCPSSNPTLPVKAFPSLTLAGSNGSLKPGSQIQLSLPASFNSTSNGTLFAAFLAGTAPVFVPYTVNQSVTIPPTVNVTGTGYVVITKSNTSATDDNTVAGPAILMFNAQYPQGTVAGSSTGNGTGLAGTEGTGKATNAAGALATPRVWAALLALVFAFFVSV